MELEKIKVKITNTNNWYKKGEIHEVNNYVVFNFAKNNPSFEKEKGYYGINLQDCVVLKQDECIPEYTVEELKDIVGHSFNIKVSDEEGNKLVCGN